MKSFQTFVLALNLLGSSVNVGKAVADDQRVMELGPINDCQVTNDPVGGTDAPACEGYADSGAKVKEISIYSDWWPTGTQDYYVIRGLGLRWNDGQVRWWGAKGRPQKYFQLANDEQISSFIVGGGSLVDWIKVNTTKGQYLSTGGGKGSAHLMELGNGELLGWQGFCTPDNIFAFAPTFACEE